MAGMNAAKARFWRRHLARASRAGLSVKRYCSENSLAPGQAAYWAKRLADASDAGAAFVQVECAAEGPPALLRVRLPDGTAVEATASVAASVIAEVVARLRSGA